MKKMKSKIIGIGVMLLMLSCKTYTITPESFKTQLRRTDADKMKEVEINNPLSYQKITYYSNNINSLYVTDKDGNKKYISNSPSLEMRVTHTNGKKYHFYFDTVILENGTLKGGRSRFITKLSREIPLDSIVKIELQEGGKKFSYQ
jgi:hypothetical protein